MQCCGTGSGARSGPPQTVVHETDGSSPASIYRGRITGSLEVMLSAMTLNPSAAFRPRTCSLDTLLDCPDCVVLRGSKECLNTRHSAGYRAAAHHGME